MTPYKTETEYSLGDVIANRMEVREVHIGGMAIVYICHDRQDRILYALKTFQSKYLASSEAKQMFQREALLWAALGKHPNIVRAVWVDSWEAKPFIVLEYIRPDDRGRNSLSHYLSSLSVEEILNFSIQFCFGMEHAHSNGIDVHRDISPDNIMISPDKTVKITDFGLAKVADDIDPEVGFSSSSGIHLEGVYKTMQRGKVRGKSQYMPPEQFEGKADKRSDVYSFGVVLHQMLTGGEFPSLDAKGELQHQAQSPSPAATRLLEIVRKCINDKPDKRFQNFAELRSEFQELYYDLTAQTLSEPKVPEVTAQDLNNLGVAWNHVNEYEKAIDCFDRAIEKIPFWAWPWMNKGYALDDLRRYDEAIKCYDKAIELKHDYPEAWQNKGVTLRKLSRYEEAIKCCVEAVKVDPSFINAWNVMARCLNQLGRHSEAVKCCDQALAISPRFSQPWHQRALALHALGSHAEALKSVEITLQLNPQNLSASSLRERIRSTIGG